MKKIVYIVCAAALTLMSCAKHDFFDDLTITGNVGPEAYWEVESSAMQAGTEMNFTVQYYSSVSDIDHSEVWYKVLETIESSVSCPWLATFTYNKTVLNTEEKRISQLIKKFPHDENLWSDSLHAYTFTGCFPVSGTLSSFAWVKPSTFDSLKMAKYFGDSYMQEFKDGIAANMKYADYRKMYLGLGLVEDFRQFTDSTLDENAGVDVYVYHFPKDETGKEVVPEEIKSIWNSITFEQLINNTAEGCFDVEYRRRYSLQANMRVYDIRGVYGTTIAKDITIN